MILTYIQPIYDIYIYKYTETLWWHNLLIIWWYWQKSVETLSVESSYNSRTAPSAGWVTLSSDPDTVQMSFWLSCASLVLPPLILLVTYRAGTDTFTFKHYCWWNNSCTIWHLWNPVNNWIQMISTGAGVFPLKIWIDWLGLYVANVISYALHLRLGLPDRSKTLLALILHMCQLWKLNINFTSVSMYM